MAPRMAACGAFNTTLRLACCTSVTCRHRSRTRAVSETSRLLHCVHCDQDKPATEFYLHSTISCCKPCYVLRAESARVRRRLRDPIGTWAVFTLDRLKRRSAKMGLPFDLTLDDLLAMATPVCPVFRTELDYAPKGRRGWHPHSPSVDRIIPELGYVRSNVIVISNRANAIKNNATAAELRMVADFYCALTPPNHAP